MTRQTLMAAAITALLATATAQAASPLNRTIVRDTATTNGHAAMTGQRFVVKTTARAAQGRAALSGALGSAVQRAGLSRSLPATASARAQPAASMRVLRSMATPGWHVVQASRPLSTKEADAFIRELAADGSVQKVELDRLYTRADVARTVLPAMTPNDPNYAQLQWNFTHQIGGVRAEQGWDVSTGEGIVVAVIDTGIVKDSPDLAVNVLPGYDMITDSRISRRATDGRVAGGWDMGDWVDANYCTELGASPHGPEPSSWHGSHVAGTIAQQTNNNVGLAGLAHGAKVLPVRVLGSCGGFGSDISDGMLWAAGAQVEGLPVNPNPAEVLNMSLGSGGPQACPAQYQDAIDQINALGSIVVVAAGNSNADAGTYTMGSCNGVITVGASRVNGGKASYSSWGTRVDIAAPGGGGSIDGDPQGYIFQVVNAGEQGPTEDFIIGGYTGTSMASPHVAAAVAMVQSVVTTPLSVVQMRDLLQSTSRAFPVTIPSNMPIGAGILDLDTLLHTAILPPCTQDCAPTATRLQNKVNVPGVASRGNGVLFSFEAAAGVPVSFMTLGGTGDVSMYVAAGRDPTSDDHDARSVRSKSNTETVRLTPTATTTYYIRLTGTFAGVTMVARQ